MEPQILLRKGTGKLNVFLVHDGTGDLLYAQILSRRMDSRITVYGLPSEADSSLKVKSIQTLAKRLVRILMGSQPKGPYYIAGWSFGGTLAYEIAAQLILAGERVAFLGLIDTTYEWAIDRPQEGSWNISDEIDLLMDCVKDYVAHERNHNESFSSPTPLINQLTFESLVKYCKTESLLPERLLHRSTEQIRSQLIRERIYYKASTDYLAPPLPIHIHFFQAQEDQTLAIPFLGWKTVVEENQLHLTPIPGNHHSMLRDPSLAVLARALSKAVYKTSQRMELINTK
jgi:arthrofactin-type cyclic lipopeptide synthetase C